MVSFRSILLAAAAFATIVSAIPTAPPSHNNIARDLLDSDLDGDFKLDEGDDFIITDLAVKIVKTKNRVPRIAGPATSIAPIRRGQASPVDIVKSCSDGVGDIILKIEAAVNVDSTAKNVDHALVINLLGQIVVLFEIAITDLKVVVVGTELTLNGVTCTLRELAGVVADLLILVIKVVWVVLSIVGFVDDNPCGVIATICALLCELLEVVLALVAGLQVEVLGLIKPFVDQCNLARFTQILVILGLYD